ncbi:MAG TPA: hypothetical protein VMU76_06170 [Acidimicrobiales bacterium]|nr:hypothetical protein [Acidimicrobiales bacterium]
MHRPQRRDTEERDERGDVLDAPRTNKRDEPFISHPPSAKINDDVGGGGASGMVVG